MFWVLDITRQLTAVSWTLKQNYIDKNINNSRYIYVGCQQSPYSDNNKKIVSTQGIMKQKYIYFTASYVLK